MMNAAVQASQVCGPSPQTALRALLEETLSESELRRLLFDAFGRDVLMALPSGTPAEVFFAAVGVLERKGLVDAALFARIVEHAPGKRARIEAVADAWGVAVDLVREPGGDKHAVIAILEGMDELLQRDDPAAVLELVRRNEALLFPARGSEELGGRVAQRLTLSTDPLVMVVETTRTRRLSSGFVASAYYFLMGREVRLLQARDAGSKRTGWMLGHECRALLDRCLERYRTREPPFEYEGDCYVFVGSRTELSGNDRLADWSAAKEQYARFGLHLRTVDGFIDSLASSALGDRWHAQVPPQSRLLRRR